MQSRIHETISARSPQRGQDLFWAMEDRAPKWLQCITKSRLIPGKAKPIISGGGASRGVTSGVWDLLAEVSRGNGASVMDTRPQASFFFFFFCKNSSQNLIPSYFSLPSYLSNRLETLHSFSLPPRRIFDLKEPTAFSRLDCLHEHLSSSYHIPNIFLSALN